ncbi:MAG: DUF1107 domain-containing protein [Candidatus Anaerobiospirillum pullicola]|uniref:DUF1107 domain-containing protein n=1 Tax=Candidatus Anaerobiospirillum pullicola TaxID=2838451 RepID=A0A948THJ0_9GAMM|nr:DUF1107 domain-containing protein [Candidatus Anaerobiospirillum pullicola]
MRLFKIYAPRLIAKHVASFFKGQFEIAEQGVFKFDGGKVVVNENSTPIERQVAREVNKIIATFLVRSRPTNLRYQ